MKDSLILLIKFIVNDWKILLITLILFLLYYHYTSTFDYFKKRQVKYLKPKILIGSLGPRVFLKQSFHEFQLDIYNSFKGLPYGGVFEGKKPVLLLRDPELIKIVGVRDFDHFCDRNTLPSREPQYVKRQLLNLRGDEWRGVRSLLTPTFSPARIRSMMPLIQQCTSQLINLLKSHDCTDVEMKDFLGHFTLEVIGACAFGIKCDVLAKGNSNFVKVADKFNFMSKWKRMLFFFILLLIPEASRFISFSFFNPHSAENLLNILTANKKERRSGESKRTDFLQLMIDASDNEKKESASQNGKINLDDDTIDAQSLLFLLAGYETSSTLLAFAVHVLATQPHVQDQLRAHIDDVTKGNDVTWEILLQLTYLERFLMETLRLYPPVSRLDRLCTKKYTLPGTNINIEVGDIVSIPIYGVHMDPDIYPDPEEFNPDRFTEEEKKKRASHLFLGFGTGPRHCIGQRFALISAKLAIVALMKNFKFSTCEKTINPVKFDKKSFLLKSETGLWVHVTSI